MARKSAVIIGKYIKKIRIKQGLSIEALSSKTDISASQISVIERGKNKLNGKYINISLTSLEMIAMGLGLTVQQILEESGYYDFINARLIRHKKIVLATHKSPMQYYECLNDDNKEAVNTYIYQIYKKQLIENPDSLQLLEEETEIQDESSCS